MSPFDDRSRVALIVVCVLLLGSSLGFKSLATALGVYLRKEPVKLRSTLETIPAKLGDYEMVGESRKLSAEIVEEMGTDEYVDRTYAPHGQPAQGIINLHITYYTGLIDAVPHVPDRCLVAAGFEIANGPDNCPLDVDRSTWTPDTRKHDYFDEPYPTVQVVHRVTGASMTVRMPVGDFSLRTTEFRDPAASNYRVYSGYFFVANGAVAPTPDDVRLISFRRSEKFAYYCKIQFTVMRPATTTRDEFLAESTTLLEALLPELMQCLPDWSEVGARHDAT